MYTAPWHLLKYFPNIQFCLMIIHRSGIDGLWATCVLKMIKTAILLSRVSDAVFTND